MRGADRAKYLYRIARIIQERSRELAVLESIDNGKPIRESRDVDLPLVAAHFFYYAGWADKLGPRRLRAGPAPDRRGRPGHPVELPAADAGLEDRPGAGRRQHGRAQAGRDDPADRAGLRRDLPAGRPAARRGQHHHRRRRDRPAAGRAPGRGQGRLHRVDRGRPGDRPVGRRHGQAAHAGAGRQGGEHRLRRRPDRPGGRGHRQRHLLQPGPRLLRRLAPAGPGVGRRDGAVPAQAADGHAAGRRPAGQEHRHRRDQLGRPARADPRAVGRRRVRGGAALVAAVRAARPRLLVRADHLHRRLPGPPHRPRGDLRARCCRC